MSTKESLYSHLDITGNGKYIWYISEFSLLMQLEIKTGNMVCLGLIPFTDGKGCIYTRICHVANKLVLIPTFADKICEYDLQERKFCFFDFPKELKNIVGSDGVFTGKTIYKEYLFIYGKYPVVVKYHIFQHTFQIYKLDIKEIDNRYTNKCFYSNGILFQDTLVIPTFDYKHLVAINIEKNSINYQRLELEYGEIFCGTIGMQKDKFYIVVTDNKTSFLIAEYDIKTRDVDIRKYFIENVTRIGIVNNKLFVFGTRELFVIILDQKQLVHIELPFLLDNSCQENYVPEILYSKNNYTVFFNKNKLIFNVDMEKLTYNTVNLVETDELYETLDKIFLSMLSYSIVNESCGYARLDVFMKFDKIFCMKDDINKSMVGRKIWNECLDDSRR